MRARLWSLVRPPSPTPALLVIAAAATSCFVPSVSAAAPGSWATTGPLTTPRVGLTLTTLPTGQALAAGGNNGLASAELYTPASGAWTSTGSMHDGRANFTATLLPNGQVLVAGGFAQTSGPGGVVTYASAELYDPATGAWTRTGSMRTARDGQTATALADGRVLVAGGLDQHSIVQRGAELYDPATGAWNGAGPMQVARVGAAALRLADGRVLVAGGFNNGFSSPVASAELYDPATGAWSPTGRMQVARAGCTATLLPSGKVLVAGGAGGSSVPFLGHPLASAELYDPATGIWSSAGTMHSAHWLHAAALLPNGRVLVAGGRNSQGTVAGTELYDPATNTWAATGNMSVSRAQLGMAGLANGTVLVAGGESGGSPTGRLSGAEIYTPAA